MKMKFEYKEPEFMAVILASKDFITTSGEIPEGNLGIVTEDWELPGAAIPIE